MKPVESGPEGPVPRILPVPAAAVVLPGAAAIHRPPGKILIKGDPALADTVRESAAGAGEGPVASVNVERGPRPAPPMERGALFQVVMNTLQTSRLSHPRLTGVS